VDVYWGSHWDMHIVMVKMDNIKNLTDKQRKYLKAVASNTGTAGDKFYLMGRIHTIITSGYYDGNDSEWLNHHRDHLSKGTVYEQKR